MEPSMESPQVERRVEPTVTKDKWVHHAINKMARGYTLIVGTTRKTANFHSREKGYEACAYNIAKQLVRDGIVVKTGDHQLGDIYSLREIPQAVSPKPSHDDVDEAEPFEIDGDLEISDEEV